MEMLPASDRRATRRSVLVDCQVVREHSFELLGEHAVDISLHGMQVSTKRRARVGEEVLVAFRVPGTRTWIDTTAKVVRVVRGRRQSDRGRALGLAFERLAPEEERVLRNALMVFPPTLPTRPTRLDYAATAALIALA